MQKAKPVHFGAMIFTIMIIVIAIIVFTPAAPFREICSGDSESGFSAPHMPRSFYQSCDERGLAAK